MTSPSIIGTNRGGMGEGERGFHWMYESRDTIGYLEGRFVVGWYTLLGDNYLLVRIITIWGKVFSVAINPLPCRLSLTEKPALVSQ